jgi:uncharacterized protein
MSYFACRLLPPRPTFAIDMTASERRVMQSHVAYWTDLAHRGVAVLFGPVADPKGPYGLGVLEVDDEAMLQSLTANDPAITSRIGMTYEVNPMPLVVLRGAVKT